MATEGNSAKEPIATSSETKPSTNKSDAGLSQSIIKPFTRKNWDAIIDEFEKEEEKDQGVDQLFKQIYQSSDEEVRRAMNKSYQESGGTVLSTNWQNVAHKRVEPKPPSDNDTKSEDNLLQ